MMPNCPNCDAELDLPSISEAVEDPASTSFHCPRCATELTLGQFLSEKTGENESTAEPGLRLHDSDDVELDDNSVAGDDVTELNVVGDFDATDDETDHGLADFGDDEASAEIDFEESELPSLDPDEAPISGGAAESRGVPDEESHEVASGDTDEDIEWLSDELARDDTDLETEDTLIDQSTDEMEDIEALLADAPQQQAVSFDGVDEAFDLEPAETAEGGTPDEASGQPAGDFEPAKIEAGSGVFEFHDPPINVTAEEPVAPEVAGVSAADDQRTAPFEFQKGPAGSFETAPLVPHKSNLLGTLLKTGIGAVVVLALLQGLGWWVLNMDPLGLADKVPSFLVPANLRTQEMAASPNSSSPLPPTSSPTQPVDTPPLDTELDTAAVATGAPDVNSNDENRGSADSGGVVEEVSIPEEENSSAENEDSGPVDNDSGTTAGNPAAVERDAETMTNMPDEPGSVAATTEPPETLPDGSGTSSDVDNSFDELADPIPGDLSDGSSQDEVAEMLGAVDPPVVEEPSIFESGAPLNFATYSRNDLASAVFAARNAHAAFDEAMLLSSNKRKAAEDFYTAFCDVAEQSTMVRRSEADEVLRTSRDLLRAFQDNATTQRVCANGARNWMAKNLGLGVLVAGDVQSIEQNGELYEIVIKMVDKPGTPVTFLTRLDPANNDIAAFQTGSRLLVMGVLVGNPLQNLPGYDGFAAKAIYVTDQIVLVK